MKNYYVNGYLVYTDLCTDLVSHRGILPGTADLFDLVSFLTYSVKNRLDILSEKPFPRNSKSQQAVTPIVHWRQSFC